MPYKNLESRRAGWRRSRERILMRERRYRQAHPEKFLKKNREYRNKNRQKIREYFVKYTRASRKDPAVRLRNVLGGRISGAMRRAGLAKSKKTLELLGCSFENFRAWLTFYFQPGMSWANYGEWHVDHIRPCASFDLTNLAQQKECFHYTNLQPLWKCDNLSKGAKYNPLTSAVV